MTDIEKTLTKLKIAPCFYEDQSKMVEFSEEILKHIKESGTYYFKDNISIYISSYGRQFRKDYLLHRINDYAWRDMFGVAYVLHGIDFTKQNYFMLML